MAQVQTIEDHIKEYGSYTVSAATLRLEDLIASFMLALGELAPATANARAHGTYADEIRAAEQDTWNRYNERNGEDGQQYLSECVEVLYDDLSANAPDGTYFGTLEGDASEFGFWSESEYGEYRA